MIRFYYRAGSAETNDALTKAIRHDLSKGLEVLLLVPEQQTVSTERKMLELLPASAQLSFEVVNFSRLANRTFRALGGHHWNTATPAVRALLMWHTLRELAPTLQRYGKNASDPKLCEMLLQAAKTHHSYQITGESLLVAACDLPEKDPLKVKILDIGTILGFFEGKLKERFHDGEGELDRLAALLAEKGSELFSNTAIYVDSFTDYTTQELNVLRALMRCAPALSFSLPLSSMQEEGLHLYSAAQTQKRLMRMAKELGCEIFFDKGAEKEPQSAREYLTKHLFDMDAEPAPLALLESPDVDITLCADPFSEAEAAVSKIQSLVRKGYRYRDITIVLRDATARCGILDAALEREGIPFFLSEKTDVTVHPLLKLILLALRIFIHAWRDEDVVAYLKTGLCGVCADDINHFEEYTSVWHPRTEQSYSQPFLRNPDGFTTKLTTRAERILAGAERARVKIIEPLRHLHAALSASQNTAEMCKALYAFLLELSVAEQLKEQASLALANGERREAEELSRLWGITVQALEDLSLALGEESLTIPQLLQALKLIFSRTDIGVIPTSADEVTIGSASMLRADHPRHVLILGLNEGEFPANVGDDGLWTEGDKDRLLSLGILMPGGREERTSDELFYLYRAFCAPSEGLHLFYNKSAADGRAATPSIAIERACYLLNNAKPRIFEAEDPISHIFTPAAALDRLCELKDTQKEQVAALLRKRGIAAAENLTRKVSEPSAALPIESADRLFAEKRMSPSHLESFANCRFAYYCSRILDLRGTKSASLAFSDTGIFMHYVLEKVMQYIQTQNRPFTEWSNAEIESLVKESTQQYAKDLREASGPLTPRASALIDRLSALAHLVVVSLFEEFGDSDFTPAFTELDLKHAGSACEVTLPSGRKVVLSGKADRVDVWKAPDQNAYLRVVDYKTGTRKFAPKDIKHGISLQMPLYLMALCEKPHPLLNRKMGLPEDTKLSPAGVTYFSTAAKVENTPALEEEAIVMHRVGKKLERSGILLEDPEVVHAASHSKNPAIVGSARSKKTLDSAGFSQMFEDLSNTVSRLCDEMHRGIAWAKPNPENKNSACKYCEYAAICRAADAGQKGDGNERT